MSDLNLRAIYIGDARLGRTGRVRRESREIVEERGTIERRNGEREEKWREIDHNHVQILGQVAKDRESIQGHFN